jgi:hypothetical protein
MSERGGVKKRSRDGESEAPVVVDPIKELAIALSNLGDPYAKISFEEELKLCCSDIKSLWAVGQQTITSAIVDCLMGLSHKTSKYSILIALLVREHSECAVSVFEKLGQLFLSEEKPWWMMGQLLRVFGELASLRAITTETLVKMIEGYLGMLPDANCVISLHYGLPFCFKLLSAENLDFLNQAISITKSNLENQLKGKDAVLMDVDYLGTFEKICQNISSSPLIRISPVDSDYQPIPVNLPSSFTFSSSPTYDPPVNVMQKSNVFESEYVDSWEEVAVYRHVFQLLSCTSHNPRRCCDLLFVSVPEVIGASEKIVAQMLFGALLSRSGASLDAEFNMIAACRHSRLFPSAMARCLLRIVDLIDETKLDQFSIRSLASWFALHLSTFDFKWPWDEFKSIVDLPDYSGKVIFMTYTFEYLSRLSYHQKLSSSIPSFFHGLLPPPPTPSPMFDKDLQVSSFIDDIKSKKVASEIVQVLEKESPETKLKFIEAVLLAGSKSLSHISVLIERYVEVIKVICGDELESQGQVMTLLSNFWKNHIQIFEFIVTKLFEHEALKPENFVTWSISSLETAINDSSIPIFNVLKRYLPSAILFNEAMYRALPDLSQKLGQVKDELIADKQVTDLISEFAVSISRLF